MGGGWDVGRMSRDSHGSFRLFDGTNPILGNWLIFFGWGRRFGGGALFLEATEVGEGAEEPAIFLVDPALHLEEDFVGGWVRDEGQEVIGGTDERDFETTPAVFAPLREDHSGHHEALDGPIGTEALAIARGKGFEYFGIFSASGVIASVKEGGGLRDRVLHTTPR